VPAGAAACPACGAPVAAASSPGGVAAPPAALPRGCVNCHTQMRPMGQVNLRTTGWVSGPDPWSGTTTQLADMLHPFSLYYCPQCGKFDLYYPGT
jgi:hypothetical protein